MRERCCSINPLQTAAALKLLSASSVFDENPLRRQHGRTKKVSAILPRYIFTTD